MTINIKSGKKFFKNILTKLLKAILIFSDEKVLYIYS